MKTFSISNLTISYLIHLKASITLSCLDTERKWENITVCFDAHCHSSRACLDNILEHSFCCGHSFLLSFHLCWHNYLWGCSTNHMMKLNWLKKKKKYNTSDLIFLFFYPSQFPDTIHSAAVGIIMLAGLAGKAAAVWEQQMGIAWMAPWLNLGRYLHCQMLHFEDIILSLKNACCHVSIYLI